jgi:hypothetical protein
VLVLVLVLVLDLGPKARVWIPPVAQERGAVGRRGRRR